MKFDVITIFPRLFKPFQEESLIQKALKKRLFELDVYNLRHWAKDKHKSVDDKPFGGGLGMVMKIDPWYRAIKSLKKKKKSKTILFTPRGKKFTQGMAYEFSKLNQLVLLCGRYEGIDERVALHLADEEISLGDFVLMGGEIPAMAVIESVARLIPGVIGGQRADFHGKPDFLKQRMKKRGFLEYPQYTRPEVFELKSGVKWKVPPVLLSGDHEKIRQWKEEHGRIIGSVK